MNLRIQFLSVVKLLVFWIFELREQNFLGDYLMFSKKVFFLHFWWFAKFALTLFRMGFSGAAHGSGGGGWGKKAPLPKICHTYPTMMKLDLVIPYPKKIQKIYESRDTPLEFCWHQHFFTENQQILLYKKYRYRLYFDV